ncbi:MAG: M23 family metallopeptidase [Bacteroidetes bacterium]|nr:M23 family metallopeptidase [Bacteroidota bacterium]MDA0950536.1 M23 family metallopeptidase [Bacteroidota bacterium]
MTLKHFLWFIVCCGFSSTSAQQQSVTVDLSKQPPLKIDLRYSGTFSELRPNHFHGGVDLKTNGREGLPIYAVADGYIRRLKVATGGYGKVIYLDHGNQYTSVYGHLSQFSPRIQSYIKSEQYAEKSYEIERYFSDEKFAVATGEIIGYSGNTGNSFGPHLHFELREQKGQIPLNPLDFGLVAEDNDPPTLVGLYLYENDTANIDDLKVNRRRISLQKVSDSLQNYYVSEPIEAAPYVGIGIEAFDRLDQSINKNGLYAIVLTAKDSLITYIQFDRFSFETSPLINQVIDFEFEQQSNKDVQLLFKRNSHPLEMYKKTTNLGVIALDSTTTAFELILKDHSRNETRALLQLKKSQKSTTYKKAFLSSALDSSYSSASAEVRITALEKSMVSSQPFDITFYQDTLSISPEEGLLNTPILARFSFSDSMLQRITNQKVFFGKVSKKEPISFLNAVKGASFETTLKSAGKYGFAIDSVGPIIEPKNFTPGQNLNNFRYLTITLEDKETSVKRYSGYIDDQWVLFEYEPKNKTLRCDLSDLVLLEGGHSIRIEAEDAIDNRSSWRAQFEIR